MKKYFLISTLCLDQHSWVDCCCKSIFITIYVVSASFLKLIGYSLYHGWHHSSVDIKTFSAKFSGPTCLCHELIYLVELKYLAQMWRIFEATFQCPEHNTNNDNSIKITNFALHKTEQFIETCLWKLEDLELIRALQAPEQINNINKSFFCFYTLFWWHFDIFSGWLDWQDEDQQCWRPCHKWVGRCSGPRN